MQRRCCILEDVLVDRKGNGKIAKQSIPTNLVHRDLKQALTKVNHKTLLAMPANQRLSTWLSFLEKLMTKDWAMK